jgi:uncharacterized protein
LAAIWENYTPAAIERVENFLHGPSGALRRCARIRESRHAQADWRTACSPVRGNLLVIPIDQSFLYVEPVFLLAEGTNIPQLKRVIVGDGNHLAMESTLAEALQGVFGERPSAAEGTTEARKRPYRQQLAARSL